MSQPAMSSVTDLQKRLMSEVVAYIRDEGLCAGDTLNQLALAQKFGVSRTPLRAALQHLAAIGALKMQDKAVLVVDPSAVPETLKDPIEELVASISRLRHTSGIGMEVTENDLMRRLNASRGQVVAALRRMAALGLVVRKAGFGWKFEPPESRESRHEGYRLRLLIEPAALLEPKFRLEQNWLSAMQDRHRRFLDQPWRAELAIPFFETNAEFHLGLTEASGNRYFVQAIRQQIGLRRLRNYSWTVPVDRVARSGRDHLAVIEALLAGDRPEAARRMEAHISGTMAEYP